MQGRETFPVGPGSAGGAALAAAGARPPEAAVVGQVAEQRVHMRQLGAVVHVSAPRSTLTRSARTSSFRWNDRVDAGCRAWRTARSASCSGPGADQRPEDAQSGLLGQGGESGHSGFFHSCFPAYMEIWIQAAAFPDASSLWTADLHSNSTYRRPVECQVPLHVGTGDERCPATPTPVMLPCERRVTRECRGGAHSAQSAARVGPRASSRRVSPVPPRSDTAPRASRRSRRQRLQPGADRQT